MDKNTIDEFLARLRALTGRRIKDFSIVIISKTVILTGIVESYYHKQLINVVSKRMFPNKKISNNVRVIEPQSKKEEEKC
jgi:hypothetical protein